MRAHIGVRRLAREKSLHRRRDLIRGQPGLPRSVREPLPPVAHPHLSPLKGGDVLANHPPPGEGAFTAGMPLVRTPYDSHACWPAEKTAGFFRVLRLGILRNGCGLLPAGSVIVTSFLPFSPPLSDRYFKALQSAASFPDGKAFPGRHVCAPGARRRENGFVDQSLTFSGRKYKRVKKKGNLPKNNAKEITHLMSIWRQPWP